MKGESSEKGGRREDESGETIIECKRWRREGRQEIDRDRDRDRERDRERQRETERDKVRQRETKRDKERQKDCIHLASSRGTRHRCSCIMHTLTHTTDNTIHSPPRYPERLLPGRFDHWFHSHQLWHTCIVLAAYVWYDDLLEYYQVVRVGGCAAGSAGGAIGSAGGGGVGGVGGGLGGFVRGGRLRGNPMVLDTVRRVAQRGDG